MAFILSGISIFLSTITLLLFLHSQVATSQVAPSVPWAGLRKGVFSKTRACIRELTAGLRTLKIGYDQFNRKGQPCLKPDPGFRPIVMLPQEHLSWLCDQSDDKLSSLKTAINRRAIEYLAPDIDLGRCQLATGVIRKEFNRRLGKMHPAIFEETCTAIDIAMGRDTDNWKEICIKTCVEAAAFRSILRAFVGSPLCHNEEYVSNIIGFSNWFGGASVMLAQMPWMLKVFFGTLGALPVYYYRRKANKFLGPLISDRMANLKRMRDDPSFKFEAPDDLITWTTQAWISNPETAADSPETLTLYMLFLAVAAIPTTVVTASNTMLDLVSSNGGAKFWGQLCEEATEVYKIRDDWENPTLVPKLKFADSTIRETLRMNPIVSEALVREILVDDGLTLPSGHLIPKGAWIGTGTVTIHNDSRFYHKPEEYDPFRFIKNQDDGLTETEKAALASTASIYRKGENLVMPSDIFLGFGMGRHACPGRWIASNQLKLMLAYMSMNYEIQHKGQRPVNWVLGDAIVPPETATMMVRRRKHT